MNWGRGLTIAMICFMSFISILIIILMSNKVDLVSEDYYQQEIAYDDEIVARNNWINNYDNVVISENENHLLVVLPKMEGVTNFEMELNRPNDNKDDLRFHIAGTSTYLIDRNKLKKGVYTYRIYGKSGVKKFLSSGKYYVK